jgi:hypothetical protein
MDSHLSIDAAISQLRPRFGPWTYEIRPIDSGPDSRRALQGSKYPSNSVHYRSGEPF